MVSSIYLFYLTAFLFLGSARASISGGQCSDVSFYDHIKYHTEKADCCAGGNNQLRCEEKEEEVCVDVTEMICDVNAYADCQVEESSGGGGQCEGGYKNFDMRDCEEREFKEAHIKQVPVCKNVTKNNCVTDWEVDDNGNKVWTGLENCSPVTWEECSIEDKEVEFPTVKTDCGVVSQIKYFDYSPLPGSGSKVSTNCSPRGSVSCRPVTRTDCVKVSYTDCSMNAGGDGGCEKQDKFVPSQEKVHQKKCLEGEEEIPVRSRRSDLFSEFEEFEEDGNSQEVCECINPFLGTKNHYRGDPANLCGDFGPGLCYVECNGGCRDQEQTANAFRCSSKLACAADKGDILFDS